MSITASLTEVLVLEDNSGVGHARRRAQALAERHGFDDSDAGRVALLATELASNVLKYATRGELHLRVVPRSSGPAVELLAVDRAKGFDLDACQIDGYSSSGTQGIGLGAIRRMANVFDVYTDARGAVVLARLWRRDDKGQDLRLGVSQHSLHGDPACGDTWHVAIENDRLCALVIDGLGHGHDAELAAKAGAVAFAEAPFDDPRALFDTLHQAMSPTRGGAVAVARHDASGNRLTFSGVGNITGCLVAGTQVRGLPSHPGIVGVQFRKAQTFDYAQVNGSLLILHSDGVQSRWSLKDYPGLAHRHPAVIAGVLHRDFCRGRDDVTVLVAELEATYG